MNEWDIMANLIFREPTFDVTLKWNNKDGELCTSKYYRLTVSEYKYLQQRIISLIGKVDIISLTQEQHNDY